MGQADSRALNSNSNVFEKGAKYGTNRLIYLEDLVEAVDIQACNNIRQAKIYLRFYEWADRSRDEFELAYRKAIENLELAAPNLRELRIECCYAYKLDLTSQVDDVLESEASLLQNRLEGLMYAWKRCQIQLYRVEVDVYWLIDQNATISIDFTSMGKKIFGRKVQLKINNQNRVQWHYYFEDTAIYLSFHFKDSYNYCTTPVGRCSWPRTINY